MLRMSMKFRHCAVAPALLMALHPHPVLAQSAAAGTGAADGTIGAAEAAALRAQLAALKAQVDALEARLNATAAASASASASPGAAAPAAAGTQSAAAAPPPTAIGWKGSPIFTRGDLSFKVKGRLQFDAAYVGAPGSVTDRSVGFSNEVRRIRLGGEGKLGGGFGYKLETELSDNAVDLVDAFITWESHKWLVTLGNHNQFQSLDELIGDTGGSVMERAAFTDAFNFERRIGLSVQYRGDLLLAQAGVFTDSADSLANSADGPAGGDENNSIGFDGRLVLAPKIGDAQLHFGASGHWRNLNRLADQGLVYRQRPFVHSSNSRFLATPSISGTDEIHYGLEAAGVMGPFHFAGEGHWLSVRRVGAPDPTFFGAYAEVGYFLTRGDTRPYKDGILGTAKPRHPLGDGGIGAVQLNLRYDYLDLDSGAIVGGQQNAFIAAVVWTPIEFLRFNLNYAHIDYDDAAIAAGTRTDYGIDVMGLRAELDF